MLIIELVMILMTGILLWHAGEEQSPAFGLIFWITGGAFGFLRELLVIHFTHLYAFGDFTLWIFGVPVIYLLFWPNIIYIALRWSENASDESFLAVPSPHQLYPLIFLTMALIAIMVEAFGSQYQMITWNIGSRLVLWGKVPVFVPFSYGLMGVLFLFALRETWRQIIDPQKRLFRLIMWIPILTLVHTGAMFVIKVGIDIFFGAIKLH